MTGKAGRLDLTPPELVARKRKKFGFFDLDGNHPALDFVNTIETARVGKEYDWLVSYPDTIGWAERVGLIGAAQTEALIGLAYSDDADAEAWHRQVVDLRSLLRDMFTAVVQGVAIDRPLWNTFNAALRQALQRIEVQAGSGEYRWDFPDVDRQPTGFLQPLIKAAADLLVSGDVRRLKQCANPSCDWFFLDTSKNKSRRWCSMQGCGNRTKAQRYQRKHKASS